MSWKCYTGWGTFEAGKFDILLILNYTMPFIFTNSHLIFEPHTLANFCIVKCHCRLYWNLCFYFMSIIKCSLMLLIIWVDLMLSNYSGITFYSILDAFKISFLMFWSWHFSFLFFLASLFIYNIYFFILDSSKMFLMFCL